MISSLIPTTSLPVKNTDFSGNLKSKILQASTVVSRATIEYALGIWEVKLSGDIILQSVLSLPPEAVLFIL